MVVNYNIIGVYRVTKQEQAMTFGKCFITLYTPVLFLNGNPFLSIILLANNNLLFDTVIMKCLYLYFNLLLKIEK